MSAATTGDRFCAARVCGKQVRVEYRKASERIEVCAVHAGDWRITADRWHADVLADLTHEAECAEITAEEFPGYQEAA
jgi:hypothetical protein